jgi:hypothetical protein
MKFLSLVRRFTHAARTRADECEAPLVDCLCRLTPGLIAFGPYFVALYTTHNALRVLSLFGCTDFCPWAPVMRFASQTTVSGYRYQLVTGAGCAQRADHEGVEGCEGRDISQGDVELGVVERHCDRDPALRRDAL